MSSANGFSPTSPAATPGPFGAPIVVDTPTVACDGGGGPLGHPRVFLRFGDDREIVCPYCSRHFVLSPDAGSSAH